MLAVTWLVARGGATHFLSLCLPARHLGTIFLWIFWPSFNSAPTTLGDGQHRTALNTYYSLSASTLSTFALSALVGGDGRLDMVWAMGAQREAPGGGSSDTRLANSPGEQIRGQTRGGGVRVRGNEATAGKVEVRWRRGFRERGAHCAGLGVGVTM